MHDNNWQCLRYMYIHLQQMQNEGMCIIFLKNNNVFSTHYSNVTWMLWHLKPLETWMFDQQLVQLAIKKCTKALHYWPFVRGIHWSPEDSPHKGPVLIKSFDTFFVVSWTSCWSVLNILPSSNVESVSMTKTQHVSPEKIGLKTLETIFDVPLLLVIWVHPLHMSPAGWLPRSQLIITDNMKTWQGNI